MPVEQQLAQAERVLAEMVESRSPAARDVINSTIGSGGKRLRPALVLLCADACGECAEQAVHLAATVELLHSGSLLHDDVFDSSPTQRGNESAGRRWGTPAAVLVGDFMAAAVYQHLSVHGDNGAMGILAETVIEMCQAELLNPEWGSEIDEATYLETISGKTAALFSASCRLGAVAAGASADVQSALTAYGQNLGMAFQITDDLLDLYGDPEKLGKSVGQDQARGLLTLAVIRGLEVDDSGEIAGMTASLADGTGDGRVAARLAERVAEVGGRRYAADRARAFAAAATQYLESLAASPSKDSLLAMPEQILGRIM